MQVADGEHEQARERYTGEHRQRIVARHGTPLIPNPERGHNDSVRIHMVVMGNTATRELGNRDHRLRAVRRQPNSQLEAKLGLTREESGDVLERNVMDRRHNR
jgi:hypothetical protein